MYLGLFVLNIVKCQCYEYLKDNYPIKGTLEKVKSSSAIESANVAVDNVIFQQLKGSGSIKRIKYIIYNPS